MTRDDAQALPEVATVRGPGGCRASPGGPTGGAPLGVERQPEAGRAAARPGRGNRFGDDPKVTPELVEAFLAEYAWMLRSRHPRERLTYRIVDSLREEVSWLRMSLAGGEPKGKWARKVEK